jgi:DUF4097 and DUF4098 domain-containing protein YvlB
MCLALAAFAQTPAPELTCSGTAYYVNGLAPYCEIREASIPFAGGPLTVKIEGSGSVTVRPWDQPDVQVRAQVLAGAQTAPMAEVVAAQVSLDSASGAVIGRGPRTDNRQTWSVNLDIRIPRETGISIQTINGNVKVEDVEGNVTITTVNGNITLTRVSGDVVVRATNSVMQVGVSRWHGQSIDLKTVNGGVELDVPRDTTAHVYLSAVAGSISTNVATGAWTVAGLGRKVSFDIGGGGSPIRAELVTGYIRLRQAE